MQTKPHPIPLARKVEACQDQVQASLQARQPWMCLMLT